MIIYMTEDQAKRLGEFLITQHAWMEGQLKREYSWEEMAKFVGISKELMVKLKEGKHLGVNGKTIDLLSTAFGPDALEHIGLLHKEPTFTLENVLRKIKGG